MSNGSVPTVFELPIQQCVSDYIILQKVSESGGAAVLMMAPKQGIPTWRYLQNSWLTHPVVHPVSDSKV